MNASAPSRVVIAGASGLIGSELTRSFEADGVEVVRLVRREPQSVGEVRWQPGVDRLDPAILAGSTAVIGLNGASIGRLPWTASYRRVLRESRLGPTRTLAAALRELGDEAPQFLSASAVGVYGSRPGVTLTEASPPVDTFLARLCVEWEAAAHAAGPHVTLLRTSPLIHPDGVLKPLMLLTKLGLSGPLGNGTQIWPWISLEDEVRAIRHLINKRVYGPVNLTGPTPAAASEIGRALAHEMHRPFLLPAPAFALRLALGEAANALLLSDARVVPAELERTGFTFLHETAAKAVSAALK